MQHVKNDMDNYSDDADWDDNQIPPECDDCLHNDYCLYDHDLDTCKNEK